MIDSKRLKRVSKILVVDDQEINRDILGTILEDNYDVIYAENGKEALDKIVENNYNISLIMLDLMMPIMNGFEVLEYKKQDEHMKNIPVIVLTSEKDAELKALELGAYDFITKPFDMHEVILARAGRIIELSEGRQLIQSAEHDRLTGLYSWNFFREYAKRIFLYHSELHMDALAINIDQFHTINALNGREFGDKILKIIAKAISDFLKNSEGIGCRSTADHFYIYCIHQDDYNPLLDLIAKSLNEIINNVNIHVRIGIKYWQEGEDPTVMVDHARAACNKIRGDYSHSLNIYDDKLKNKEILNQRLLNDLKRALDEHEFQVYFQPKFNIQTTPYKLSSAEALIRWKHHELGMISPGDFIPLFEGNGLISLVDNYVWKETARCIAKWEKEYNIELPVSVNLSRADLNDRTLVDRLNALIIDNKLNYKDIKLEITESAYNDNPKYLIEVVNKLRDLGFEIEMDDFGSGYSSLNALSSLPIDVLKMDMKFVRNIEVNETDLKLVMIILDIAKYLNVPVVAEGVETIGQLELLKEAGCKLVQGYYFSKPLPLNEFEEFMKKHIEKE